MAKVLNAPFATQFSLDAFNISGERVMGRQAAGNSYLRALFNTNYENLALYIASAQEDPRIQGNYNKAVEFLKKSVSLSNNTKISFIPYDYPVESAPFGGIFRPDPKLDTLAYNRGYYGHNLYSLLGITHTTASHSIMTTIRDMINAPLMPWDALICTSQAVKDTVSVIHNDYYEYLEHRFGMTKRPNFQLPIIPLGINTKEFDKELNKKDIRSSLGIDNEDIVILFVGRISFHAKAHNLPMFLALEKLAKEKNKNKLHFIMAGWFPNDDVKRVYKEEAKEICPSINVIFIDGRDQEKKFESYAIGDIFFSLTDNIQETFGLTPLEGMASEMPVVVSDWNGYRETVRDGIDGFRIKTTSFPKSISNTLAYRYDLGFDTYDRYCGYHSQFTSVDLREAVDKLKILIDDKNLRKELGSNAKKYAIEKFDWSSVLKSYESLRDDLVKIRKDENKNYINFDRKVSSDRLPPYKLFQSYPSRFLNKQTQIIKINDFNSIEISAFLKFYSIDFASVILPNKEDIQNVLENLELDNYKTLEDLVKITGINADHINMIVTWLLKYGYIDIKE